VSEQLGAHILCPSQFTMQNAVLKHFHDARVVIRFTNRSPQMLFSKESFEWIKEHVMRECLGPYH
jgi:nicotinic acid phosphoribosyltransferase